MPLKKDLDLVNNYQKELSLLGSFGALASWDEQTYLPEGGVNSRAEQNAFLSKISHKMATSNEFFSVVKRLNKSNLKGRDKIMIEKLYKGLSKSRKLPVEFVEEMAKTISLSNRAWIRARQKKDFKIFAPHLEKVVKLKQKEAKYYNFKGHIYNGLLDDYEEGMTVEKIKPIFSKLKEDLISLINKIEKTDKYRKQKVVLLNRKYEIDKLKLFTEDVSKRMGMNKENSRIDLSEHPFTTKIGYGDVRITTSFRDNPMFSFLSTVHEAGHALYELGMPEKDKYNSLGNAPSVGIHESQSRIWENNIGRGIAFWKYYFPKFNKELKLHTNFSDWYNEISLVRPGMIRVEADEVHYCLHVILRFEIEIGLIDGSIKVRDLPKVWNKKMKESFGKEPRNDAEGVLQDIHWSWGSFGYFPTYAIGTIYAAQLWKTLRKKYPEIEKEISKGNFGRVREWLRKNIHEKGSIKLSEEIIKEVCGYGLKSEDYINYLTEKYGKIYGFSNF